MYEGHEMMIEPPTIKLAAIYHTTKAVKDEEAYREALQNKYILMEARSFLEQHEAWRTKGNALLFTIVWHMIFNLSLEVPRILPLSADW